MPESQLEEQVVVGYGLGVAGGVEEGEVLEVLGRANGGKTGFMVGMMREGIGRGLRGVLFSSSRNCTRQWLESISREQMMVFQF